MTITDGTPHLDSDDALHVPRVWTVQKELTREEREELEDVPPMTDDALALLAGLLSRIGLCDPGRQWGLSNWALDPLDRTASWNRLGRRLLGHGVWWELTWSNFPFSPDVVRALAEPQVGIVGARTAQVRRGWDVHLGDAVLALRPEDN
ncbi:hypothetical protein ABZ832_28625 [Streptantibioticus parmotrematis]|uniref:hypothetical protein n=1 Tax=Streptantibioticus parmotrematis TaxID=2873249 RepID=UPI0033F3191C